MEKGAKSKRHLEKIENEVGKKYGEWIILSLFYVPERETSVASCQCSCGTKKDVIFCTLEKGKSKSCGCKKALLVSKALQRPDMNSGFNALLGRYKRQARDRNLEFSLSPEQFKKLTRKNCYYCGDPPSNKNVGHAHTREGLERATYIYSGIDRIINEEGYIDGNVLLCCKVCNRFKSDLSYDKFLSHINKIYNRNILCKSKSK